MEMPDGPTIKRSGNSSHGVMDPSLLPLNGTWTLQPYSSPVLENASGGLGTSFRMKIVLPDSADQYGFGEKSKPDPKRLTREHRYGGPAGYQKTIYHYHEA